MTEFDRYVLVINSSDFYQQPTAISDQIYMMNNTNIPAGKYKCRWSFRCGSVATVDPSLYPTIYLRTSAVQQAYAVNGTGGNQISYCLGTAKQVPFGTACYYHSSPIDNTQFYLNYVPGYEMRITLRNAHTQNLFANPSNYIMMIEMDRVD